jgi:hypothetical protein
MHTSIIVPLLLHASKLDQPTGHKGLEELEVAPEALIREARQRQRRRRLTLAGVTLLLLGTAVLVWRLAFTSARAPVRESHRLNAAALPRSLTLHVVGWGTPIQGYDPRSSCPDGKFNAPIVSSQGQTVGSFVECDLVVSKTDKPDWGVRSTHAALATTYTIHGGTIEAREQRTFLLSRQYLNSEKPIRTRGSFRGRITGGSGRYVHVRGTVTGGGLSINNNGSWTVTFHFN